MRGTAGVAAILLVALVAGVPARAEVPRVQILPFIAPLDKASRNDPDSTPITLTFEVPDEGDVAKVCRMTPRIRDAINEELFARPLKIDAKRTLDLIGVEKRLLEAVNKALGESLVSGISIETGARQIQTGGAKFAGANACAQVNK